MRLVAVFAAVTTVAFMSGCSVEESITQCTAAPQSEWQNQDQFQAALLSQGFEISEFKVTEGNCYEIYGKNPSGEKVEIYFNPVDASIVKEEKE